MFDGFDGDQWMDFPEAAELQKQMATLEEKITNFKQEIENDDDMDSNIIESNKWSKPVYRRDPNLPEGWTCFDNGKGSMFYRNAGGKFIKNRRNVLTEMYLNGGFSRDEIQYIRDGLVNEGWKYHQDLPVGWMFKQYTHKIEGVDTDVLYNLSPNGTIFRSKKKIKKNYSELELSSNDLQKLLDFRPEDSEQAKTLENPDDNWVFHPESVPQGWKMKKYTFNSSSTNKTEEVYHYLCPDKTILRGKKQVYTWMIRNGCYNSDDFALFHFNKKQKSGGGLGRPSVVNWSDWGVAGDLPGGWMVRNGFYKYQKKVQYKSPNGQIFLSRFKVIKFLKSGDKDFTPSRRVVQRKLQQSSDGNIRTVWDEWRDDDIPCLPGWQFSIGRKKSKRKIRYKSPCGKVFKSRGPLIRYLHENNLKGRQQLITLKKLLKTNQSKHFEALRTNDKFIKNFTPDWNYLLFLKIRYDNQRDIPELEDYKLPTGWRKKSINGVDYFKDPSGKYVFNSRKLVVEHLRKTNFDLSDDDLVTIMEDSGSESDLSESEHEESDSEEEDFYSEKRADNVPLPSHSRMIAVKTEQNENSEILLSDFPVDDLMTF